MLKLFKTLTIHMAILILSFCVVCTPGIKKTRAAMLKDGGNHIAMLMIRLFENPTNLELNFQVMQAQMAEGNLEAAEATLERVLILDPESRLARFLMAEIRIKLGKLASARVLLVELIEDPDTAEDTRQRAEILVASIDSANSTRRHSGGYSLFMGQTDNAFGRSEENSILFLDLPAENTTKDKSDQFYGYQAYYRVAQELNSQIPTQLDGGVRFSLRDTHDPSLSDIRTVSADVSLVRSDKYRLSAGLFGSYTDVNHQDFSRSMGLFLSARIPVFSGFQVSTNVTGNRSIYMKYDGVADNPGKSGRAFSTQFDITRPIGNGFVKLGLSTGVNKAENNVNNYRYEKSQLTGFYKMGFFSATASVSRQSTRYEEADVFVSSKKQKSSTNQASLNMQFETFRAPYLGTITPYINMKYFETSSNIPNYRRNGGEVSLGMGGTF